MSTRLPVIAVSGHRFEVGVKFKLEAGVAIPSDYVDAVTRAGGLGVVLASQPLDDAAADDVAATLDGLVLTGGPDVTPSRYGQEAAPETYGTSDAEDGFETALLRAMFRADKPVLCICRGLQVLNVELGGTLHQHIPALEGTDAHGIPNGGGGTDNGYEIVAGSLLAKTMGIDEPRGRCHHHQAVDAVAPGLEVTARTADGTVEALERDEPGSWLLAVQWHPEETAATDPANQSLFDALVRAAR